MKYPVLLIDLDGTIHDYLSAAAMAKSALVQAIAGHFHIVAEEVLRTYDEIRDKTDWHEFCSGHAMRTTRIKLLLNAWPVSSDTEPKLWVDLFSHAYLQALQPFPDALQTTRLWHSQGRQMAIVTEGFADIQRAVITTLNKAGLVDLPVIISKELGVTKQDGSAIVQALNLLNAKAENAVMMGDNWTLDILPAAQLGVAQIWISQQALPANIPANFLGIACSLEEANCLLV